jgi:hypothetical protein
MKNLLLLPLLALLVVVLAGCGDDDREKAALTKACPAARPAMKSTPTLPGDFPNVRGITYTGVGKDGPTTVATGYVAQDLDAAHAAYSKAVKGAAGYNVTKDEQDAADAEVNFRGGGNSGQVKLLQTCKNRTQVTITIRPA